MQRNSLALFSLCGHSKVLVSADTNAKFSSRG